MADKRFTTSVMLTKQQRIAVSELHLAQMIRGERKATRMFTMSEIFIEGLRSLLASQGKTLAEVDALLHEPEREGTNVVAMRRRHAR